LKVLICAPLEIGRGAKEKWQNMVYNHRGKFFPSRRLNPYFHDAIGIQGSPASVGVIRH
jgi:hypothetical protein